MEERSRKKVLKAHGPERLLEMNQLEFAAIVKPYVRKRRPVTPDMRAHGLRMKLRSWSETLRSADVKKIRNPDLRIALRSDLESLAGLAGKLASKV